MATNQKHYRQWTEDEIEAGILLHHVCSDKLERLSHLNKRFGKDRTLTGMKKRITASDCRTSGHENLWCKWVNYQDKPDEALARLEQLLGKRLTYEKGHLWETAELISLAALSSGPSTSGAIAKRLQDQYGIVRDVESQIARMQQPDCESHAIWTHYHLDQPYSEHNTPYQDTGEPMAIASSSDGSTTHSTTHTHSVLTSPSSDLEDNPAADGLVNDAFGTAWSKWNAETQSWDEGGKIPMDNINIPYEYRVDRRKV